MNLPYFKKPHTEGQRLFNLQYEYKNGRAEALGELYDGLRVVAYKVINKISDSDINVKALSKAERIQKAHDAATYIIEQFLKRPDFTIKKSISGYLYCRVMRELYGVRKCDKMLVFTDKLPKRAQITREYHYIVKDQKTGASVSFSCLDEMLLNPIFRNLRKKRLVECIKNGTTWKNYKFELLEL